jgi:hypothetical protein
VASEDGYFHYSNTNIERCLVLIPPDEKKMEVSRELRATWSCRKQTQDKASQDDYNILSLYSDPTATEEEKPPMTDDRERRSDASVAFMVRFEVTLPRALTYKVTYDRRYPFVGRRDGNSIEDIRVKLSSLGGKSGMSDITLTQVPLQARIDDELAGNMEQPWSLRVLETTAIFGQASHGEERDGFFMYGYWQPCPPGEETAESGARRWIDGPDPVLAYHRSREQADVNLWAENIARFRSDEMRAALKALDQEILRSHDLAYFYTSMDHAKTICEAGSGIDDIMTPLSPSDLGWVKQAGGDFLRNARRIMHHDEPVESVLVLAIPRCPEVNTGQLRSINLHDPNCPDHFRALVQHTVPIGAMLKARQKLLKAGRMAKLSLATRAVAQEPTNQQPAVEAFERLRFKGGADIIRNDDGSASHAYIVESGWVTLTATSGNPRRAGAGSHFGTTTLFQDYSPVVDTATATGQAGAVVLKVSKGTFETHLRPNLPDDTDFENVGERLVKMLLSKSPTDDDAAAATVTAAERTDDGTTPQLVKNADGETMKLVKYELLPRAIFEEQYDAIEFSDSPGHWQTARVVDLDPDTETVTIRFGFDRTFTVPNRFRTARSAPPSAVEGAEDTTDGDDDDDDVDDTAPEKVATEDEELVISNAHVIKWYGLVPPPSAAEDLLMEEKKEAAAARTQTETSASPEQEGATDADRDPEDPSTGRMQTKQDDDVTTGSPVSEEQQQQHEPSLAGWLRRKSGPTTGWRREYCVLTGYQISWFEDQECNAQMMTFDLRGCVCRRSQAPVASGIAELELVASERTHRLDAETEEHAERWLAAMSKATAEAAGATAEEPSEGTPPPSRVDGPDSTPLVVVAKELVAL